MMIQCEGYVRKGGAFSFGPVQWVQCENEADCVVYSSNDKEDPKDFPSCYGCLVEAMNAQNVDVIDIKSLDEYLEESEDE